MSFAKIKARDFSFPEGVSVLKKEALETIEQTIGYRFKDKQLISQAFTRSLSLRAPARTKQRGNGIRW